MDLLDIEELGVDLKEEGEGINSSRRGGE